MAGRALAEAFVRVRADTSGVRKDIRDDFTRAGGDGGKAFGDAFTRDANGRLHNARGRFVRELSDAGGDGGRSAGNRFASAFGGSFRGLGRSLTTALGGGMAGLKKLAGLAKIAKLALIGLTAALAAATAVRAGAALAPLAGGLLLIPAAALSAATALGTLKLATSGMADAFKLALTPGTDPKKLAESMKYLSPAARSVVLELNKLRPTLLGIRNTVQQALFQPLIGQMSALAKVLSGPIRQGAAAVATQFGFAGRQVAEFARQSKSVELVRAAFGQTQLSVNILRTALIPLLGGFRALATEGLSFLPRIATAVAQIAARFGEWLQKIVASGQATQWINNFFATLKQLGGILSNVGGILKSVFSAASAAGSGFLGVIGQALGQLNAFLKTAAGKSALQSIFQGLAAVGQSLAPVIGALVSGLGTLAKPLGQLAQLIGPILTTAISALAPALAAVAPGLKALFDGLGQAVTLIAPALKPLGAAIGQIGVAIGPILPVVADLVGQLVSGLAPILGELFVALGPLVLALVQLAGAFTPLIPPLAQIIVQLVSGLVPALTPLIGIMGQIAGVVGQFLVSALGMLASAIVPLLPQLSQMAQTVGNQLLIVLVALSPALLQVLQALLPLLPQLLATIPPFVQLVIAITPLLVLLIRLSAVILRTLLPPLVTAIGIYLSFGNAQAVAIKTTASMISMISRMPGQIVGALKSAGSWLYNTGRNVVVGLWNGISSLGSWLASRVWSWVKAVLPGPIKFALGIHSPSKVMAELGRYAGMGLAVGLDASSTGVSRASNRLAAAAVPAIGNNGLTVAATASGGGSTGFNPVGLADAVAAGIQRAGIAVHMDSQPVGQIISRQQGRLTDQRRRTG